LTERRSVWVKTLSQHLDKQANHLGIDFIIDKLAQMPQDIRLGQSTIDNTFDSVPRQHRLIKFSKI